MGVGRHRDRLYDLLDFGWHRDKSNDLLGVGRYRDRLYGLLGFEWHRDRLNDLLGVGRHRDRLNDLLGFEWHRDRLNDLLGVGRHRDRLYDIVGVGWHWDRPLREKSGFIPPSEQSWDKPSVGSVVEAEDCKYDEKGRLAVCQHRSEVVGHFAVTVKRR